jgi:hypothetical protein
MGIDGSEIKRQREAREKEEKKRADREQRERERESINSEKAATAVPPPLQDFSFSIDCAACKLENGMDKRSVPRFPTFIRFIGLIIAVPSAIGMLIGASTVASSMASSHSLMGIGVGGGFFTLSAVGGLVGWLLLMSRKAFVCRRCGYMLDRA